MRIAIIGAGMAGLSCAARLGGAGADVALFDKGRRPGGRMSTLILDDMAWDYGATHFVPASPAFMEQTRGWQAAGVLAPWVAGPRGAMVGVPHMASLVQHLGAGQTIRFDAAVHRIERARDGWQLKGNGFGEGPFDAVVLAIPPEQALPLLSVHDFALARAIVPAVSRACWTVMIGFAERVSLAHSCYDDLGPIDRAVRNNSKPGRSGAECWVIQACPDWSLRHLEWAREEIAVALLFEFKRQLNQALPDPVFLKAHRWRFAAAACLADLCLWQPALRLGLCGDWWAAPGIEGAWHSGRAMADAILASLPRPFNAASGEQADDQREAAQSSRQ